MADDAVLSALGRLSVSGEELSRRVEMACSRAYWLELNPDLSISDNNVDFWTVLNREDDTARLRTQYEESGYAILSGALSEARVHRMRKCVDTLRRHHWPPIFSFVYDPLWTLGMTESIKNALTTFLGEGYQLTPKVSLTHVPPSTGNAGWPPHFDGTKDARLMSAWVPLSLASPANGCMYAIARKTTLAPILDKVRSGDNFTIAELQSLLQHTMALPANPGEVFFWGPQTLHWGGLRCADATESRVSVTLVFCDGARTGASFDPFGKLPSLTTRLRLIGAALIRNLAFDKTLIMFQSVAERLRQLKTQSPHVDRTIFGE